MSDLKEVKHIRGDKSLTAEVFKLISKSEDDSVFFISDFAHLGDADVVRKILGKLCQAGVIERLAPGMFYKPHISKFGIVPISLNTVATSIAQRDHASIMPTGDMALNILGLSTQVPANAVYLTSGSARTVKLGNRSIRFMRGVPKNFAGKGKLMPLIIQALKTLGKNNIDGDTICSLTKILAESDDAHLSDDLSLAPQWIKKLISPLLPT